MISVCICLSVCVLTARHVADIVVMKFVCTCVCVSAAYHDTVEQTGGVCTGVMPIADYVESSLSTLTGEELDAFAETLPLNCIQHNSSAGTETFCDSDDGYTV